MVFGQHREATSSQATDTILLKRDSFPTYHFASVVDDHSMGITHVVRGEVGIHTSRLLLHVHKLYHFHRNGYHLYRFTFRYTRRFLSVRHISPICLSS